MKFITKNCVIMMVVTAVIAAPAFSILAQTASSVVDVSLPVNLASEVGSRVAIPIAVSDVSGKGILGYKIMIRYNPALLRLSSASAENTLSRSIQFATSSKNNIFTVAAFGSALAGSGTLIILNGEILKEGTIPLIIHLALFNEGDPSALIHNGSIIVPSRNVSNVLPGSAPDASYLQGLVAQLQAQIMELQTRIHTLQAQALPVPTSAVSCPTISRDLFLESQGNDVAQLQQFLRESGYFMYPTNTGYFGPSTARAVQLFQSAQGIVSSGESETTGYGIVGKQTREAIAKACGAVVPASVLPLAPSLSLPAQELPSLPPDIAVPPPLLPPPPPPTTGLPLETWNGTWNNENSATDFNTRLAIAISGTNFALHPWSSCCDWGERTVAQTSAIANNTLSFDWSESFKTTRYTLTLLSTTRLHSVSKTTYTDGRPGYTKDEYFTKSVAVAPINRAGLASVSAALADIIRQLSLLLQYMR